MKDKKSVFDLTPEDFPVGVPALKWKRGLYYRPNNSGYTNELITAGLYDRDEVVKECFNMEGKNGRYDVFGMPLWMALQQGYWSKKKIREFRERLSVLEKYCEDEVVDTVIF